MVLASTDDPPNQTLHDMEMRYFVFSLNVPACCLFNHVSLSAFLALIYMTVKF